MTQTKATADSILKDSYASRRKRMLARLGHEQPNKQEWKREREPLTKGDDTQVLDKPKAAGPDSWPARKSRAKFLPATSEFQRKFRKRANF